MENFRHKQSISAKCALFWAAHEILLRPLRAAWDGDRSFTQRAHALHAACPLASHTAASSQFLAGCEGVTVLVSFT